MVGAADTIRGATDAAELRRAYAEALAEVAEDRPYEIATLRRVFLERQEHLIGTRPETAPPEVAPPAAAPGPAADPKYERKSRWEKPSFWITIVVLVILWMLIKRLVLKG